MDEERHGLVAAHRPEQDAVDPLAAGDHPAQPLDPPLAGEGLVEMVGAGQPQALLPASHASRGTTGRAVRRFSRAAVIGRQDRRRVVVAVEQELDDVLLGRPVRRRAPAPPRSARRTPRRPRRWPGAAPSRRPHPPACRHGCRCGPARSGRCTRRARGSARPSRRLQPFVPAAWCLSFGFSPLGLRLGSRVRRACSSIVSIGRCLVRSVLVVSGPRCLHRFPARLRLARSSVLVRSVDPRATGSRPRSPVARVAWPPRWCRPPRCPCSRLPGTS